MPKFSRLLLSTLALAATAGLTPVAWAADAAPAQDGAEVIRALGRLNGISLACEQLALVDRSRQFMVRQVPKTRQNGEQFEDATHATYLEFTRQGQTCPATADLAARIEQAGAALAGAFGAAN